MFGLEGNVRRLGDRFREQARSYRESPLAAQFVFITDKPPTAPFTEINKNPKISTDQNCRSEPARDRAFRLNITVGR